MSSSLDAMFRLMAAHDQQVAAQKHLEATAKKARAAANLQTKKEKDKLAELKKEQAHLEKEHALRVEEAKRQEVKEAEEKAKLEAFEEKIKLFIAEKEATVKDIKLMKTALKGCSTGDIDSLQALLQREEAVREKFKQFNPLHFAASENQVEVIRLLVRNGFSLDKRNGKNKLAIDVAAEAGKVEATEILEKMAQASPRSRMEI